MKWRQSHKSIFLPWFQGKKTWSLKRLCFISHLRCFIFCGNAAKCFIRRKACFTQSGPAFSDEATSLWSIFRFTPQYEASSFHSDMKHSAHAPYDEKMKNESFGLLNYNRNSYIPWLPFINWNMGKRSLTKLIWTFLIAYLKIWKFDWFYSSICNLAHWTNCIVSLFYGTNSASNRQYFSVFLLFAFVNMLIGVYITTIAVLWGLIPVLLQWIIDNRYISANSLEKRLSKKVFCYRLRWNVSGEIVSTHLAGRSLAWW